MYIIALYTKKTKPVAHLQRKPKLIILQRQLEMDSITQFKKLVYKKLEFKINNTNTCIFISCDIIDRQ